MLTINRAEQYVRWMFKVRGVGIAFMFCWNRPLGCITLDGKYRRFFCGKELGERLTFYSLNSVPRIINAFEQAETRAEKAEAERKKDLAHCKYEFERAEDADANVARLREQLEYALDKIAEIEGEWESEGVCHACGICAGIPYEWQRPDGFCCRVAVGLWIEGKPLPWEAARRAVADAESEVKK